jgi:outer membrane protein OmpA-like peptidoglycan-associated protein/tetratricopeptide (TPR) repeat protein
MKQFTSLETLRRNQTISWLVTLVFTLTFSSALAQNDSIPNNPYTVIDADRDYDDYRYNRAQSAFLQLVRDDADFTDKKVIQSLADTYFFNSQYNQSYTWYRKLISLYPEDIKSIYYLRASISARSNENYAIADRYMQQYFRMEKGTVIEDLYVEDLNYLDSIAELRPKYIVEKTKINTEQSDFSSAFFGEDKLVFSSTYQASGQRDYDWTGEPFLDLYIADIGEEGQLENTQQIEGDINTAFHESSAVFTKDLDRVYFTRNNYKNGKKRADRKNTVRLKLLTATVDDDGNWSDVEELSFNNDNYSVAHPALSLDGKKLYFASDMPGTTGESDLWYVDIYNDGSYGDPINLGQKVNTEGRESFPYVADDGNLYFTSDALVGFGGFDVFKAELSDSGIARDPENMGLPINSAGDDFGFLLQTDTNTGYISSNRDGNRGSASDQIYYFKPSKCVVEITGLVKDSNTGELMPGATVKLLDMGMNIIAEQIVQQDARYSFPEEVECGEAYYLITENGLAYSVAETTFVAPTSSQSVSVDMAIETFSQDCPPYDLGCLLGLNPIYFDLNKYYIRPDAEIELTKVFNAMIRFPELIVRIESHTDSRSPQSYNLRLSQNRATSTRNWLLQRGIAPSRLSAVGYGESQLINRCADGVPCTEAEHQLNRRSMFIIENYQMLPMGTTSTPTRPAQAYSQVPRPTTVNTAATAAVPPPIPQPTAPRVQNTTPTRPTPVVPPVRVSPPPSAIPPVVTSTPPVVTSPPAQNTPRGQEEPAPIVIQVTPQPNVQTPPSAVSETKNPENGSTQQGQNTQTQQPPVRSAEEALQILENHRNQGAKAVPKSPQPPAPPQTIVIQVRPEPTTEERSTTTTKTSPPVRSAVEALQILENHRNKTQGTNSNTPKRTGTQTSLNQRLKPVNLPNEKAPADTLDDIVAKLKANKNNSVSFNLQNVLADADIVYVVQIAALINRRDVNHKVFRGLSGLSTEKFREFHRYLYRPTASYQQAKIAQRHVISKGFTKAFIVAYVNGTRTSAREVAKLNNQN